MSEQVPDEREAILPVILHGARSAFANALELFREASILADACAVARALCLHQISLEECSKVDNLGAWATSLILGHDVDQRKVLRALSGHKEKNQINAYMLEVSDAEAEAMALGDLDGALELFKQTQEQFHASSNQAKNASLYVDWVDGAFVSPAERITEQMLAETRERNSEFLGYASNNVNTLARLVSDPDAFRDLLLNFVEDAERLRNGDPAHLSAGMEEVLARFIADGMARAVER